MSPSTTIRANVAIQWLEKVLVVSLRLASFIVITRALSPVEVGRYSLVTAMVTFFIFLTDMGLDDTLVKILANRQDETESLLGGLLMAKLGLALASVGLLFGAVLVLGYDAEVLRLTAIASLSVLCGALSAVTTAYFRTTLRMLYVSAANIAGAAFFVAAVALAASKGWGLAAYMVAWSLSSAVTLLVAVASFARYRALRLGRFDVKVWRGIALAALPLGVAYLVSSVYSGVDVVILSRLADFGATGVYSAAYKFVHVGVMFPYALVNSTYPLMARYWRTDRQRLRNLVQRVFDYLDLIALPAAVVVWILAPDLMLLLFEKPEFVAGAPALRILGIGIGIMCPSILTAFLLAAMDRQKASLAIGVIGMVVNVALNLLLVPRYGYMATATVTVVTELVVLGVGAAIVRRDLGMRLSLTELPKAIAVALACGAALSLTSPLAFSWRLLALAVAYVASALLTGAVDRRQLSSMLE